MSTATVSRTATTVMKYVNRPLDDDPCSGLAFCDAAATVKQTALTYRYVVG